MTLAGLFFMVSAWVFIIAMTIFSFRLVLKKETSSEGTHNKS